MTNSRLSCAVFEGERLWATMICCRSCEAMPPVALPSRANHPARHVLDVHHPLTQKGIVDLRKSPAVFLRHLMEDILDVRSLALEIAQHLVNNVRSSTTRRWASKMLASLEPMARAIRCWVSSNSARVAIRADSKRAISPGSSPSTFRRVISYPPPIQTTTAQWAMPGATGMPVNRCSFPAVFGASMTEESLAKNPPSKPLNYSSPKRLSTRFLISATALSASIPSAITWRRDPFPAASIMSPMMLFPFTLTVLLDPDFRPVTA